MNGYPAAGGFDDSRLPFRHRDGGRSTKCDRTWPLTVRRNEERAFTEKRGAPSSWAGPPALPRHRAAAGAGAKEASSTPPTTEVGDNAHARAVSGPGRRDVGAVAAATAGVSLG